MTTEEVIKLLNKHSATKMLIKHNRYQIRMHATLQTEFKPTRPFDLAYTVKVIQYANQSQPF